MYDVSKLEEYLSTQNINKFAYNYNIDLQTHPLSKRFVNTSSIKLRKKCHSSTNEGSRTSEMRVLDNEIHKSNLALRNFLVNTKKFLKVKSSLFQTFNQSTI